MPTTIINVDTGINQVQDGSIVADDLLYGSTYQLIASTGISINIWSELI